MTDLQTWCAERTAIAEAAAGETGERWLAEHTVVIAPIGVFDADIVCHDAGLDTAQHIAGMDPTTVRLVMAVVSAGDMVSHYWHVAPASPETGDAFDASLEMLKRDLAALRAHVGREGGDDDTT